MPDQQKKYHRAEASAKVRVTAKSKDGEVDIEDSYERPLVLPLASELPEHPATVGCSVSVGRSTEYAREKLEVSCWCTLPCGLTKEDIESAYAEARYIAQSEAKRALKEAHREFFPHVDMEE